MTHSLWFLVVAIALILIVDMGFYFKVFPGDTISESLHLIACRQPVAFNAAYFVGAVLFWYHLEFWP